MEIPNDKKRKREEEDVAPTEKIEIGIRYYKSASVIFYLYLV
jgi:hypothetical protein